MARSRTSVPQSTRPPIRMSVPLDVRTHARLVGLAALRGVDRSELAASFIAAGLKGVTITVSGDAAGSDEDDGRAAPKIASL